MARRRVPAPARLHGRRPMLLFFVTLGIWGFVHYYQAQEEMLRHSGTGLGGVAACACRAGIPGRTRLSRHP